MKRRLFSTVGAVMATTMIAQPVSAQWIVEDPGVLASINAQTVELAALIGTSNANLINISRATTQLQLTQANMMRMMSTPAPGISTRFATLDGGATQNVIEQSRDFSPTLNGDNMSSISATKLLLQAKAELLEDETKGFLKGTSAEEVASRERQTTINFQGQAQDDMDMYRDRWQAINRVLPQINAIPDFKTAMVWNVGVGFEILKSLTLLGQSISANTSAQAESTLYSLKEFFRIKDDHEATAKIML